MKNEEPKRLLVDISWEALLKVVIMAAAIWAVWALRSIFLLLFVVFIFVAAVHPTITRLQRYMSRQLAVTFFFTVLILILTALSYLFIPRLIEQFTQLIRNFPIFLETLRPVLESLDPNKYSQVLDDAIKNLGSSASQVSGNVVNAVANFFGGLTTLIIGLVLSFYLLLEEKNAKEFLHQVMPTDRYQAAYITLRKISAQLGAWIRGQFAVMMVVGVLNVLAYFLLGLPSPLALGIWAGLAEAIPYIGPFLGVIPGLIVAIASGEVLKVVLVIAINYFLVQQLQNFYITPKIMGKVIGISPVLIILAITVAIALFGIVGAIIALPVAAMISVIVSEWPNLQRMWVQADGGDEEA